MITIEAFDPATAPDAELQPFYEYERAIEAEVEPGDPFPPFETFAKQRRLVPSYRRTMVWLARDHGDNGAIVGAAHLHVQYVETNRKLGNFWVSVRADRRREGIAHRLLAPLADAAAADDRTLLGSDPPEGTPGDAFTASLGAEKRSRERRSRLVLADIDRAMLDDWVARAKERASEYTLLFWEDKCPDELVEQFVPFTEVMNTAPRDDLDMEDWTETPERYAEDWERAIALGDKSWTLCARHEPTGELGGFTDVWFADWMGDLMWQGNTGVDPKHREKGLGRWLKAAMLQKILDERPQVARIDTWNAGSNEPMLAINVALGFRPVKYYGDWQIPTDALRDAAAKRS
jgi:RimJ/RimL family protein N-acetyltransferase